MDRSGIGSTKNWPGGISSNSDRGEELLELVRWQVNFGHRYPGSPGHRQFTRALAAGLSARTRHVYEQRFKVLLRGEEVTCVNLIAHLPAAAEQIGEEPAGATGEAAVRPAGQPGPLLLGTHFDTRLKADNERDPLLRDQPIPGANDGGSGTAILLHLLGLCRGAGFNRDILFVFFDAEDIGQIDNHPFSVGARYFAANPLPVVPEEVIILDMVGGRDMILDVDAHACLHPRSRLLAERIFRLARLTGYQPLLRDKKEKLKYIICDHIPFIERDIASYLLIDIDYPEWHTQADLPEALSPLSLQSTEDLLLALLAGYTEDERP